MARLYHRLFYQVHCFFSAINQEGWEEWKALVFVNTLCILLVVEVAVWLLIVTRANMPDEPLWVDLALVGACTLGNYAFFLHEDRWQAHAQQFRSETVPQQRRAAWGALAAVLAIMSSVVGAFYCMSRVDWGH